MKWLHERRTEFRGRSIQIEQSLLSFWGPFSFWPTLFSTKIEENFLQEKEKFSFLTKFVSISTRLVPIVVRHQLRQSLTANNEKGVTFLQRFDSSCKKKFSRPTNTIFPVSFTFSSSFSFFFVQNQRFQRWTKIQSFPHLFDEFSHWKNSSRFSLSNFEIFFRTSLNGLRARPFRWIQFDFGNVINRIEKSDADQILSENENYFLFEFEKLLDSLLSVGDFRKFHPNLNASCCCRSPHLPVRVAQLLNYNDENHFVSLHRKKSKNVFFTFN